MKFTKKELLIVLAVFLIGIISGLFAMGAKEYYAILNLPVLSPPNWLFGVVWPILYILNGFALVYIYRKSPKVDAWLFYIQYGLNFIWAFLFFIIKNNLISLIDLLAMLVLVLILIIRGFKNNKAVAYLLLPYLLWLIFATYLNYNVLILN